MPSDPPVPAEPEPTPSSEGRAWGRGGPTRSEDIAKAAELGQRSAQHEAELHERLKQEQEDKEQESKKLMTESMSAAEAKKEKQRGYRTMIRSRNKELAEDKARREKQFKFIEDQKKSEVEKNKKDQAYMRELREASALKIALEQKENRAKRTHEDARHRVEGEHRRKLEEAERSEYRANELIDKSARSRKVVIDEEAHVKLFKLDSEKRMKLHELENQINRELSLARSGDLFDFQRHKSNIDLQARAKHRKLESDIAGKRQAIESEARSKHCSAESEAQAAKAAATGVRDRAVQDADRHFAIRLNDIEKEFQDELRGQR